MLHVPTVLFLGALLLTGGARIDPWPDYLDELAAVYFTAFRPVARA